MNLQTLISCWENTINEQEALRIHTEDVDGYETEYLVRIDSPDFYSSDFILGMAVGFNRIQSPEELAEYFRREGHNLTHLDFPLHEHFDRVTYDPPQTDDYEQD